jgi:hypothetical protein
MKMLCNQISTRNAKLLARFPIWRVTRPLKLSNSR